MRGALGGWYWGERSEAQEGVIVVGVGELCQVKRISILYAEDLPPREAVDEPRPPRFQHKLLSWDMMYDGW